MKIIHLSTSFEGGAGIAATKLNDELVKRGIDSKIIYLSKKENKSGLNRIFYARSLLQKIRSFCITKFNLFFSEISFFSLFSMTSIKAKNKFIFQNSSDTIIHVHNFYNLISVPEICRLSKLGYRIVITMHDQRLMTGGCHSTYKCSNFKIKCDPCPHLPTLVNKIPGQNFKRQSKLELDRSNVILIAPSFWILQLAKVSPLTAGFEIAHIPNLVYSRKDTSHRSIGNNLRLGLASADRESKLKGALIIQELLEYQEKSKNSFFEFIYLNDFQASLKSNFWESIDILFVPSLHDNSPNVIHEGKSFGIPIIASRVGGIAEILHKDFDSSFDPNMDSVEEILNIFRKYRNRNFSLDAINQMQNSFESYLGDSVSRHMDIYSELLSKSLKN